MGNTLVTTNSSRNTQSKSAMDSSILSDSSSSSDCSGEHFRDCPIYQKLHAKKGGNLKPMDDPDFLATECKILNNKFELLEKKKRKLKKDKEAALAWSKQLRQMSFDLQGEVQEIDGLRSEYGEIQKSVKALEEETKELQAQKELGEAQLKKKMAVIKSWANQFAAARPVISACRNVFTNLECLSEVMSENSVASDYEAELQ